MRVAFLIVAVVLVQGGHFVTGRWLIPEDEILIGLEVPGPERMKRMYSSFGMLHNRGKGKVEDGVLLCRAIIAMASTLQKNLDNNNYTFNDIRNFIKLLKIIADPRFKASC